MKTSTALLLVAATAALTALGLEPQTDAFLRERGSATAAAKDALESKAPPKMSISSWLNSKPLAWKDLKGKVVLIDFWAHW